MDNNKRTSKLWNYFDVISNEDRQAVCKLCHKEYSYKTTINNLKKHLQGKHGTDETVSEMIKKVEDDTSISVVCEDEATSTRKRSDSDSDFLLEQPDSGGAEDDDEPRREIDKHTNFTKRKRTSNTWHFFDLSTKKPNAAECRLCTAVLSYKTSISNLKSHLVKRHPIVAKELERLPSFSDSVDQEFNENGDGQDDDVAFKEESMQDFEVLEEVEVPEDFEDEDALVGGVENGEEQQLKIESIFSQSRRGRGSGPFTKKPKLDPEDKWAKSCEKFGAYVASLMLQIPRKVAANYQLQIVRRLMDESLKHQSNSDL